MPDDTRILMVHVNKILRTVQVLGIRGWDLGHDVITLDWKWEHAYLGLEHSPYSLQEVDLNGPIAKGHITYCVFTPHPSTSSLYPINTVGCAMRLAGILSEDCSFEKCMKHVEHLAWDRTCGHTNIECTMSLDAVNLSIMGLYTKRYSCADAPVIPEYTMEERVQRIGHEFKIKKGDN